MLPPSTKKKGAHFARQPDGLSRKVDKTLKLKPQTQHQGPLTLTQHNTQERKLGKEGEGEKREKTKTPGLSSENSNVLSVTEVGHPGQRIFLCAPTSRMEDQTQHDDESYNQDNVGTGAEISTENDVLQSAFLERIILRVAW